MNQETTYQDDTAPAQRCHNHGAGLTQAPRMKTAVTVTLITTAVVTTGAGYLLGVVFYYQLFQ
jgi:hypothetical protein